MVSDWRAQTESSQSHNKDNVTGKLIREQDEEGPQQGIIQSLRKQLYLPRSDELRDWAKIVVTGMKME